MVHLSSDMTEIDPKRRANMARIGPRDTAPELAVRRVLHRMGYRFRLHRRDLPGKPDVVLPRHHTIFLIHGCFWHRHSGCRFAYHPKSRVAFWEGKFERNVARDRKVEQELRERGWTVQVIWECETRDSIALEGRLREMLTGPSS
jgi:DNA mismatch endonuclease (patch repair protein)